MSDLREKITYCLSFRSPDFVGTWQITEVKTGKILMTLPHDDTWDGDGPPPHVRKEYERIIGFDPNFSTESAANLVEIMASNENSGFDQACKFGNRVEDHAVYCHNATWLYAPRKCRRTWYTGGEKRDEDCEGYQPNPRKPA